MAVDSFRRVRGYPKTQQTLQGQRIITVHQDRYEVKTLDTGEIGEYILDQLPIPIGALLDCGPTPARIVSRSLDRHPADPLTWYVDVTADSRVEEEDDENTPPDQRLPEWSWDFETIERVATKDASGSGNVSGRHIVNAVGEPFELTVPIALPVLTIERWQTSFSPQTIINYVNRVNSTTFWGAQKGVALMAGIRDRKDTQQVFQGQFFRKVTYTIKFALPYIEDVLEGWKALLLNRGTFYFTSASDKTPKPFLAQGSHVTGNLTATGEKAADGAEPVVLKFDIHKEADFNALQLGPF